MAEEVGVSKKGSNQALSSSGDQRRSASKGAERTRTLLQTTKAPRVNPSADTSAWWLSSSEAKKHCRRTSSTISGSAAKELDSLATHMPNFPDTDARMLALDPIPM